MSRKCNDWIDSYMEYTDNTEPPLLYRKWTAISILASVLRRKVYIEWDKKIYPNMYIVLVGPSGKCRKGTAMGPGLSFLSDVGVNLAAEAITREALIRELKNSNDSDYDPITEQMTIHSSLTIFSPELTVFLGYNNVNLMADLADWYDCRDRWTYRTKNMGTDEIHGVWVNLLGATTPELIQSTLPRDAIGGGLASRIIFVYEEDKGKLVPAPFKTSSEMDLEADLEADLQDISGMSGMFNFDKGFLDGWIDWYMEQSRKPPFDDPRFSGYIERRPTHILKLSMIMSAASDDKMVITHEIFERALDLLQQTERRMTRTFSGVGRSDLGTVTSDIMRMIGLHKRVEKHEILNRFYQDVDSEKLDVILRTLMEMKFCKRVTTEHGEIYQYLEKGGRDEKS